MEAKVLALTINGGQDINLLRFRELPLEIFDEESLSDLGQFVGKTIRMNSISVEDYNGRYTRVCVEVNLDKLNGQQ